MSPQSHDPFTDYRTGTPGTPIQGGGNHATGYFDKDGKGRLYNFPIQFFSRGDRRVAAFMPIPADLQAADDPEGTPYQVTEPYKVGQYEYLEAFEDFDSPLGTVSGPQWVKWLNPTGAYGAGGFQATTDLDGLAVAHFPNPDDPSPFTPGLIKATGKWCVGVDANGDAIVGAFPGAVEQTTAQAAVIQIRGILAGVKP
jgi:hypothetical protein